MKAKSLLQSLPVDYSSVIDQVNRKIPMWISRPLFQQAIRFLGPLYGELGIRILTWSRIQTELKFSLRKRRMRMDEDLNAGAIAGLGQVTAALLILRNLDTQQYKFQLKEMNLVMKEERVQSGLAKVVKDEQVWARDMRQLQEKGRSTFRMEVSLLGDRDQRLATVRSHWLVETR